MARSRKQQKTLGELEWFTRDDDDMVVGANKGTPEHAHMSAKGSGFTAGAKRPTAKKIADVKAAADEAPAAAGTGS